MLRTRIITGAVVTAFTCVALAYSHIPWVLNVVVALFSVISIYELYKAALKRFNIPLYIVSSLVAVAISFLPIFEKIEKYIMLVLFVMALEGAVYFFMNLKELNRIPMWMSILAAVCITGFYRTILSLRAMDHGLIILIIAILTPVITDIFAYFIGRSLGRHRLAPAISPKKTIEGSIGGTVYAVVINMLVIAILGKFNIVEFQGTKVLMIFLLLASIIGQFGDLAFSSIKRIVGIKDYGRLLPGHGGLLDRFDSVLFVLPFTYLFLTFFAPLFI